MQSGARVFEGGALVRATESQEYAALVCAVPAELHSMNHPDWEIELADLHLGRVVGEGEFGVVHHGMWNGTPVAIKVRRCTPLSETEANTSVQLFAIVLDLFAASGTPA